MKLKNKRIVIIGGSSGIGFATAKAAIEEGANVIIAGRDQHKLARAKIKLSDQVEVKQVDMENEAQLQHFFSEIGHFDHLHLPASEVSSGEFLYFPIEKAKETFNNKFWGAYRAVMLAYPNIQGNGSVTFYSGRFGLRPTGTGISILAAVNGALEGLSRALAIELAPIRFNVLSPGLTQTELWDKYTKEEQDKIFARACENFIIKRPASSDEIAQAAIYLMTSSYTTGSTLCIDGGYTLR